MPLLLARMAFKTKEKQALIAEGRALPAVPPALLAGITSKTREKQALTAVGRALPAYTAGIKFVIMVKPVAAARVIAQANARPGTGSTPIRVAGALAPIAI